MSGAAARLVVFLVTLVSTASLAAADLPRVASTSLCGDNYLIKLADPQQIVSLSRLSSDPAYFWVSDTTDHIPRNQGSTEELLMSGVDLVLSDGWVASAQRRNLQRFGIATLDIPIDVSFDDVKTTILRTATALGHPQRGQQLVDQLTWRIARLRSKAATRPRRRALYLWPTGGSAGSETFVNTVFELVGLTNVAAQAGLRNWGKLDSEQLAMASLDVIVGSFFTGQAPYAGRRFLDHPVLRQRFATTPVIEVPGGYWSCGGWPLIEAAEFLDRALADLPATTGEAQP